MLQPDQKFSMSQKKIVHRSSEVIDAAHPNDWHGDPPQKTVHRTASLVPSTSWTSGRFDSLIRLPLHDDTVNQLSQAGRHRLQWTRGPWRAREGRCCSSRANGKPPASESGCLCVGAAGSPPLCCKRVAHLCSCPTARGRECCKRVARRSCSILFLFLWGISHLLREPTVQQVFLLYFPDRLNLL